MKKLPIDVSTFSTMMEEDYLYVDKTHHIISLLKQGRFFFLSRPRRFGKSLLVSTLKELFSGNRALFKGCAIAHDPAFSWKQHPVIHFDFSTIAHYEPDGLRHEILHKIDQYARNNKISLPEGTTIQAKLEQLVSQLATHNKVVILIDEYDHPLISHLDDISLARSNQKILKSFYATIKALDAHLRFVFITGITKFSKTSIFSGMNNLNDISFDPESSALCGYTHGDLEQSFLPYIEQAAQHISQTPRALLQHMKEWYNGYRFSQDETLVYTPFSILYFLTKKEFRNFWFESGTPSFLITILKQQYPRLKSMLERHLALDAAGFSSFDLERLPIVSLLYQTGYLTIKEYHSAQQKYVLGYPNKEVELSFKRCILSALTDETTEGISFALQNLNYALESNDVSEFCATLQGLLGTIPYHLYQDNEAYFHSLIHIISELLGLNVQSEVATSNGRIDMTLITPQRIFIFEFKMASSPREGLKQIDDRRYPEKFSARGLPITYAGISFKYADKKIYLECLQKDAS